MPRTKHSELAAGVFVVAALAAGLGVLTWLGAANVFGKKGQTVYFASTLDEGNLGLDVGSVVKVGNAWAGQVKEINVNLEHNQTLYKAELGRTDLKVYSDAQASAVSEFIGGAYVILQTLGTPGSGPADARKPVMLKRGPMLMLRQAQEILGFGDLQRTQLQEILANVQNASQDVRKITGQLTAEMSTTQPDALLARVRTVASNLENATASLARMSRDLQVETERNRPDSLLAKIRSSADNVQQTTGTIAETVKRVAPSVEETVSLLAGYTRKDLADILARLSNVSSQLETSMKDLQYVAGAGREMVAENRHNIDQTIADLKSTAMNLNAAAKEIRRNPWRLLQQPGEKDVRTQNIYDSVRAFGEGAEQLDDAVARLQALRQARPQGIPPDDAELLKVRQHLEEAFRKFRTVEDTLWKELNR